MSKDKGSNSTGFLGLLFLVFLVLKLCKIIDWSWRWVTSPLWIGFVTVILIGVIYFAIQYIRSRIKIKKR